MGGRYQVVIDKIRHTGEAAGRVADGVRGAACGIAVPSGDLGMPGARVVGKMAEVRQALEDRERGFESRLGAHAANMGRAADLYAHQEAVAAADLIPATGVSHVSKAV